MAFNGTGSNVTSLNAANISSGTVATARLATSGTASSSTFLRGDQTWAAAGGDGQILNTQIFTSSGTWTKPTGSEYASTDTVVAMYFGAGQGGFVEATNESSTGSGGSGGQIAVVSFSYGPIASSLSVTIGAGGAGASVNPTNFGGGNAGGLTSFNGYSLRGAGADNVGIVPTNTASAAAGAFSPTFRGATGRQGTTNISSTTSLANGAGGGGGGSGGWNSNIQANTLNYAGGISIFGLAGSGGTGNSNGAGTAGNAPSGGGGGSARFNGTATSGAGARGEMRIYVARGKIPLDFFLGAL